MSWFSNTSLAGGSSVLNARIIFLKALDIEMCAQGMEWDLLYILQMSTLRTFQDLAMNAHDIEMTIASHCGKSSFLSDFKKEKVNLRKI